MSTDNVVNQANPFSNNRKQPTLGTFIPTIANPTFSVNPSGTATLYLRYPTSLQKCVTDLSLSITSSNGNGIDINYINNNIWEISGVTLNNENIDFSMTAIGVAPTVLNGCDPTMSGVIVDTSFSIIAQVPPTKPAPYTLDLTNYAGPPYIIAKKLFTKGDGSGSDTDINSYLQQVDVCSKYAETFVDNFIKYNAQSKIFIDPIDGSGYHLPINSIYVGIAGDPVQQGVHDGSGNVDVDGGLYPNIKKNYAYTDSSSNINGSTSSDDLFKTWRDPPILKLYEKLIQYNWNVHNEVPGYTNKQYVKLGINLNGSRNSEEEWWFDVSVNNSGEIYTIDPSGPKRTPSIIDGIPNDGNQDKDYWENFNSGSCMISSPYYNFKIPKAQLAGWNCLERWFKYIAYCNQRLRVIIDSSSIVTDDNNHTMKLNNIGTGERNLNPIYCQISSITSDVESNSFGNILYNNTESNCSQYGESWFSNVKAYQVNAAIKALWNKWINQDTSDVPTPTSSSDPSQTGWPLDNSQNPAWPGINDIKANHTRYRMPATSFDLSCSISVTYSNEYPLPIKDMKYDNIGNPDFDAVTDIFYEIYDTSDEGPYRCLGANTNEILNCKQQNISGMPFTVELRKDANSNDPDSTYVKYPERFAYTAKEGIWDNLISTTGHCSNGLNISSDGNLVNDNTISSSFTTFNDDTNPVAPRILTSKYDPWITTSVEWQPTRDKKHVNSIASIGYTLEGSRYDLYHGMWAKQAAIANETEINYNDVFQGENGANGALIWSDLSTGLKIGAAIYLKKAIDTSYNHKAAAGQIYMLSCEAGPFVNNAGTRPMDVGEDYDGINTRLYTSEARRADYLTFMCPDSAIAENDYWPGWQGMRNQWYGPGTTATANKLQRWATDQMKFKYNNEPLSFQLKTNSSEDNFGVFYDIGIQEAAWAAMSRDLRGEGLNKGYPITRNARYIYSDEHKPRLGCYEVAFIPLSWYRPGNYN
jgi:hypothetical protein